MSVHLNAKFLASENSSYSASSFCFIDKIAIGKFFIIEGVYRTKAPLNECLCVRIIVVGGGGPPSISDCAIQIISLPVNGRLCLDIINKAAREEESSTTRRGSSSWIIAEHKSDIFAFKSSARQQEPTHVKLQQMQR